MIACDPICEVYFPSRMTGIQTAIWCLKRRVGTHLVHILNVDGDFKKISVLSLGKFDAVPVHAYLFRG